MSSSFFKLCEAHLGTFRVLLKYTFICLLPLVQDVLEPIISFSLCPINQVSNLETFLPKFNDTLVILCQDFALAHLELLQVPLLLCGESLLFACLGVYSLGQDALLLVEMLKLFCELLVLSHVLLRFLNTDTIVLSNCVELGQAIS